MTDKKTTEIGGVSLTDKEIAEAQKQGVKDEIADRAAGLVAQDTGTQGTEDDVKAAQEAAQEAERFRVRADLNSLVLEPILNEGLDNLEPRLRDPDHELFIPFDDVKGLLHLERSGKNRTAFVNLFMDVLGVTSPYQVSNAGPAHTNDVTPVTPVLS